MVSVDIQYSCPLAPSGPHLDLNCHERSDAFGRLTNEGRTIRIFPAFLGAARMGTYTIKELEQLSRVQAHTIRIWEKRYALLRPRRSATNIRSYSDDDLRKLLNVALLSNGGLKISRIAKLSDAEIRSKVLELAAEDEAPAGDLNNLILAMTDLDEDRLERIISHAVLRLGFENAMYQVLIPFLGRIGVLWQAGSVHPGQEHFVSNIIRQKLITAIDALVPPARTDRHTVVLFLPEGELHELGLLFSQYIAKKAGHKVIYLGQNVPLPDLLAIVERHRPDVLVTAFITTGYPEHASSMLRQLTRDVPRATIIAYTAGGVVGKLPARVRSLQDLKDLERFFGAA